VFQLSARCQLGQSRSRSQRQTMLRNTNLIFCACLLSVAIAAPGLSARTPRLSASTAFDAEQAMSYATYLASSIGERPAGSPGEALAAGWLASTFGVLSYTVEVQPFPFWRYGVETAGMNVVGIKTGKADYGTIYVGAHYDTVARYSTFVWGGPGANDDASGTGVLLELAQVLATEELSPTIKFIAFGAEEDNLAGSNYYAQHIPVDERMGAIGMIDLDCVGLGSTLDIYVTDVKYQAFAEGLGIPAEYIGRMPWGSSDYASFGAIGVPSVLLNMHDNNQVCGPDYHLSTDTADKLQPAAMDRVGSGALQAIRRLANAAVPQHFYHGFLPAVVR
jgi:aminopeptidase YwaD